VSAYNLYVLGNTPPLDDNCNIPSLTPQLGCATTVSDADCADGSVIVVPNVLSNPPESLTYIV